MPDNLHDSQIDPRLTVGGNRPPIVEDLKFAVDGLPERLMVEFKEFVDRTNELASMIDALPAEVTDANQGMFSDAVAQITAHTKVVDAKRKELNVPILFAQRSVNGFCDKYVFEILDSDGKGEPRLKQILESKLTKFQVDKIEAEKRRRAAEEAEARRKEVEAQRAAQEAERKAREAREAEARRIADEERKVREAAAAEQKRKDDEERERQRVEAEKLAKITNERQMKAEIERQAKEKAAREERERVEAIARQEREAREATERAARESKAAEDRAKAEAEAKSAQEAADRAAAEAEAARKATAAKAASLHTTRGDYGSNASLTTRYAGSVIDREKMLESAATVWPFIKDEHLAMALNAIVKLHKDRVKVEGCIIAPVMKTQVRG